MKLYFFISSKPSDNNGGIITVSTNNAEKASALVAKSFVRWGYKGYPKQLAV